jgi:hypothetical protein
LRRHETIERVAAFESVEQLCHGESARRFVDIHDGNHFAFVCMPRLEDGGSTNLAAIFLRPIRARTLFEESAAVIAWDAAGNGRFESARIGTVANYGCRTLGGKSTAMPAIGDWPWQGRSLEVPMRFFFNIQDTLKIQDEVGREFSVASEAVVFAKHLAADVRCLETAVRPTLAIEVVAETAERIHRERVFA